MQLALWVSGLDSPEETATWLHSEGVTAVEVDYRFFIESQPAFIERAVQALRDANVKIWSVHAPFGGDHNLSHLDESKRRDAVRMHIRVLNAIADTGANVLIIHPGVHAEEGDIPRMSEVALRSLEELLPVAEDMGVRLALENMLPDHPGAYAPELRTMVERFESPWLGICFDTGHAHVCGNMLEQFEALQDLIITFHIHDNDGTRDMHLPPGYGTVDWVGFVNLLKRMNFPDPIVIEAGSWQNAGHRWLAREVEALLKHGPLLFTGPHGKRVVMRCSECGHILFGTRERFFCRCTSAQMV